MADSAVHKLPNGKPNGLPEKKLDVVVAGGSHAGLIVGLALKRLGHNVIILERGGNGQLQN